MNFEKNQNGCIRFSDTSFIPDIIYKKILLRFRHLGYDIPDTKSLKEYLNDNIFLQKDQSQTILDIFANKPHEKSCTDTALSDTQMVKETFGTTNNVNLAGYILLDGSMLCMSYEGYKRNIDHREINEIVQADTGTKAMIKFINYGNIRINSAGFELSEQPTKMQIDTIRKITEYFRRKENSDFYVDIANNEGTVVKTFTYDTPTFSCIMHDINNYLTEVYDPLTDDDLQELWDELTDVPFNEKDHELYLEKPWFIFEENTSREEIWEWFDHNHSAGIVKLMYPNQ